MNNSIAIFLENNIFETTKDTINVQKIEKNIEKYKAIIDGKIQNLKRNLQNNGINTKSLENIISKQNKHLVSNVNTQNSNAPKIGKKIANDAMPGIFGTTEFQTSLEKAKTVGLGTVKALVLFVIVVFINSLIVTLMLFITGNALLAFSLGALFIAPLTEETAKYISIKMGATGQFWFIFNAAEFMQYVSAMVLLGAPLFAAVTVRLMAVLMHTITTYIMYKTRKENIRLGQNPDEKIGFIASVLIHFFWNLSAIQLL